jgi:hypothetical protein
VVKVRAAKADMDPRLGVSHSHHYMHRALLIREIADAIVRELHLLQTQLSDVLALAKTCHALSEPAFDIIWAHPPLDALARRMSPRIWEAPKEPWSPRHPLRRRVTLPLVGVDGQSSAHVQADKVRRGSRPGRERRYRTLARVSGTTPDA